MKKILSFILIFVILATPASAEPISNESLSLTSINMPMPFTHDCGGENARFYEHSISKFASTSGFLTNTFEEYLGHRDFIGNRNGFSFYPDIFYVTSLMDTTNYFNMIITYNIPDEVIIRAFEKYNAHFKRFYDENHIAYNSTIFFDEDIAVLLTRDEATVLSHFATEYAIVIESRAFTPAWIYAHSIEDYNSAGITSEMIQERLHLYAEFPFTIEATFAFEAKLSEFLGRDVILANERRVTTADALAILRHVAGIELLPAADSEITTADALMILRIVAGLQ
jgi:hypothetical protein